MLSSHKQLEITGFIVEEPTFPQTRYQGSKLKLIDWIQKGISELEYNSVLDAFGGTGVVSFMFKKLNKSVTYNDFLKFNHQIGIALIENKKIKLSPEDIETILTRHKYVKYPSIVSDNFSGIFFTDEENDWIDMVIKNIDSFIENKYKKALALFAVYQSSIIKRPYNLFHRKNLYMRTANVKRNFGNKTTWEKPFEHWFRHFVDQANNAVFDNGQVCRSLCHNVHEIPGKYDLVYIDPPYVSPQGVGLDYLEFYNFLEGLTIYDEWTDLINYETKHRTIKHTKDEWTDKNQIASAFDRLFFKFKDSILVVSYRDPGIPSHDELITILRQYKKDVIDVNHTKYKYVLSHNNSSEQLLIAK